MPSKENEYLDWSLGEIVDRMIVLRLKGNLAGDERAEYTALVEELDRVGRIVREADAEIEQEMDQGVSLVDS